MKRITVLLLFTLLTLAANAQSELIKTNTELDTKIVSELNTVEFVPNRYAHLYPNFLKDEIKSINSASNSSEDVANYYRCRNNAMIWMTIGGAGIGALAGFIFYDPTDTDVSRGEVVGYSALVFGVGGLFSGARWANANCLVPQ